LPREKRRSLLGLAARFSEAAVDLPALLQDVATEISELHGGAGAIVFLIAEGTDVLAFESGHHPDPESLRVVRGILMRRPLRVGDGITGKVVESGEPLLLARVAPEQIAAQTTDELRSAALLYAPHSVMIAPLVGRTGPVGAVATWLSQGQGHFDEDDVADLNMLCRCAALTIDNARVVANLAQALADRDRIEAERLELEARVQHAQKLESLGVLAGGIAHDFNNLLVGILGNVSLAQMQLPPGSAALESLGRVELAATRASELTNQMLAYSGKGRFVVVPLDLSEVVQEMAHLLEVSISKRAVLRYDFAPSLPCVEADASQLRQVVMNLITNASDAVGDRSGVITVSTGLTEVTPEYLKTALYLGIVSVGTYVHVEVSDTGGGIIDDDVRVIFEPFHSSKGAGRGLGLAAVLGIVKGHQGVIRVYTEEGKGTSIKVLFPASDEQVARAVGHVPSEPQTTPGRGRKVLIADDEDMVRLVASRILELEGYEVVTAADGREAVERFEAHADELALVLLDMTMPRMSGSEAYQRMRAIRDVPTILTSGYNEQDATSRFAGKGLAGFLQKPWTATGLLDALRAAIDNEG